MSRTFRLRPARRRHKQHHRWFRVFCPVCQQEWRAFLSARGWCKLARRQLQLPQITCEPCTQAIVYAQSHGGTVEEWRNPERGCY